MGLGSELKIDPERFVAGITKFIREKVKSFKRDGIILGLSGGIDSTCIAALSTRAVGSENVLGFIMPERDSDPKSKGDAEIVAKVLGIRTKFVKITPILETFGTYSGVLGKGLMREGIAPKLVQIGCGLFPQGKSPFLEGLSWYKVPMDETSAGILSNKT